MLKTAQEFFDFRHQVVSLKFCIYSSKENLNLSVNNVAALIITINSEKKQ